MKHIDRRKFLETAIGFAIISQLRVTEGYEGDINDPLSVTEGKEILEQGIILTTPSVAENGNSVPISVEVKREFARVGVVRALHIFASKNPNPKVATFTYSEKNMVVKNATRIRLAETQRVIAVAELLDGRVLKTSKLVKVTLGGCGT